MRYRLAWEFLKLSTKEKYFELDNLNITPLNSANNQQSISADISKLRIGNKLVVTELVDDKFSILHPENTVVVQVRTARSAILTEDEEEGEEGEEKEGEDGASEEAATE